MLRNSAVVSFANWVRKDQSSLRNMAADIHLDIFPSCNTTITFLSRDWFAFGREMQLQVCVSEVRDNKRGKCHRNIGESLEQNKALSILIVEQGGQNGSNSFCHKSIPLEEKSQHLLPPYGNSGKEKNHVNKTSNFDGYEVNNTHSV